MTYYPSCLYIRTPIAIPAASWSCIYDNILFCFMQFWVYGCLRFGSGFVAAYICAFAGFTGCVHLFWVLHNDRCLYNLPAAGACLHASSAPLYVMVMYCITGLAWYRIAFVTAPVTASDINSRFLRDGCLMPPRRFAVRIAGRPPPALLRLPAWRYAAYMLANALR